MTRRGASRASNEPSSHDTWTPDHPAPSEDQTDHRQHDRDERRPADRSRRGDGRDGPRPWLGEARAHAAVRAGAARGAASHAPTSAASPSAIPIHGRAHGGWTSHASSPAQNAAAAAGSAHAFIPWRTGRICSSVDGPMPLTSIRSSTVANGPFCVR